MRGEILKKAKRPAFLAVMITVVFLIVFNFILPLFKQSTHAAGLTKYPTTTGGNWSADATWTLNADGTTNATTKPDATDDVIMNATSGAVTVNAASVAKSLDCTGYTNTLTHNAFTLTVSGSVTLAAGKYTTVGAATLAMNATGTLISAGNTLYALTTSVGTITLGDNLIVATTLTPNTGSFDTNGKSVTSVNLTMGASLTSFVHSATSVLSLTGNTYTSTFKTSYQPAAGAVINSANSAISGAGVAFQTLNLTGAGIVFLNIGSAVNLTRTGTAVTTDVLQINADLTVSGILSLAGQSATNRLLVQSNVIGTPKTITLGGSAIFKTGGTQNVDFMDITVTGGAANERDLSAITGLSGDCGGNTGITFTTSATQTWATANGGNWSGANWGAGRVPLPQDDVAMGMAYSGASKTVTVDMSRLGRSISWTGATGTPIWGGFGYNANYYCYGNLTLISGMTFSIGAGAINLAGRSSYTLTSAGKHFYFLNFNAPGGTYTLIDAVYADYTLNVIAGNFVTAGYSVTGGYEFVSMSGITRSVDITNSTVTSTNSNGGNWGWRIGDAGLTLTTTGSTIVLADATSGGVFWGGTKTYNNIQMPAGGGVVAFSGAFTFANMTMSSAGTKTVKFTKSTTYTMTGSNFLSGTAGNLVTIDSNDGATAFTLTKASGTVIANYDNISRTHVTGGAHWYMTANSTPYPDPNINGNSGWLTDTMASTNPTTTTATVGGTPVTSGSWISSSTSPIFTFSGATDADFGVSGYYVYYGTNSSADPAVSGTYQAHVGAVGDNQTYDASGAVDGSHYYFRIKTKNNVGFISVAATLFDLSYDITRPTRPTFVASDPAGYTTTNSFTFTWPAGTDPNGPGGGASGIKWYEYKRATDGAWSHTADATTRTVAGVLAYQEGANAFYVRTIDNVGNISSDYQQVTYYWSGTAPDKPTGLAVTPGTSDQNSFTISWDKPVVGLGDSPIVGYYYSINATPTISNVTYVGSTADITTIGPDAFATLQGVNTVYVLSVNSAGSRSFESAYVASATFICQTPAPPIPINVSLYDSSDRSLNRWMLTIQWQAGAGQDPATFSHYAIYRSTNGLGFSLLATTTSTAYIDASGLNNSTTYYYNIKAVDNAGQESAQSSTVSKMPTGNYTIPPAILSGPTVTDIKATSATISWSTDRASSSIVRYGTGSTSLTASTGQFDSVVNHSVTLSGLSPGTVYYFQVQSLDENRDYLQEDAYSITYNFVTLSAPAISNVQVSNLTLTTADISWETTTVAHSTLYFGQTNSYGLSVDDQSGSGTTTHNVKLSSLESGTTYHFKISGTDADNNILASDDYQFDTLPLPQIENLKIEAVSGKPRAAFKASWTTNVPTTTILKYRLSTEGEYKESTGTEFETGHIVEIDDLLDDSTYYIIAQGRDATGNLAESEVKTFKTALDTRSPVISNVRIESSMIGADAKSKNQVIVRWNTDEPTTSLVEYGPGLSDGYTGRTDEEASLITEHTMMISGLEGQTPYHLHVIVKDKGGNKTQSESQTFTTGTSQQTVWQIIIRVLGQVFGFIKIGK